MTNNNELIVINFSEKFEYNNVDIKILNFDTRSSEIPEIICSFELLSHIKETYLVLKYKN